MNRTATRRVRQSVSIAAAALRDPSTEEILRQHERIGTIRRHGLPHHTLRGHVETLVMPRARDTGFRPVHDLPDIPLRQSAKENPEASPDFSDDSPQPFFDGSPWDIGWCGSEVSDNLSDD